MRYLSRLSAAVALILMVVAPLQHVSAYNPYTAACSNAAAKSSAVCSTPASKSNPLVGSGGLLIQATHVIAIVAGAVAVIIIILSGIRFITANGDSSKAAGARSGIIYALIGLVVIIVASSIITFVVGRL